MRKDQSFKSITIALMKVFFLLMLVFLTKAMASPDQWRQFQLKVYSEKKILGNDVNGYHSSCTGTLVKFKESCHLITNAHCFKSSSDYAMVSINTTAIFPEHQYDLPMLSGHTTTQYDLFYRSELFVELSKLEKRFITKDLAEIKISKNFESKFCQNLRPVNLKVLNTIEKKPSAYAGLGYFMDLETVSFTGDKAWNRWKEKVVLEKIPSGLNLDFFYHVPKLTTFKGMSGGLLINDDYQPIGILTRHIPYQEESFVIGLQEVEEFVNEGQEPEARDPEIFFKGNRLNHKDEISDNEHGNGGNEHGNGGNEHGNGGNEHGNGGNEHGNGGNEHGNGGNEHGNGGNEHGNGGNSGTRSKALTSFRAPDEGVLDPFESEKTLLNICGHQIDGYEDYVSQKSCKGQRIYRDSTNSLPEEYRSGTLKRILGNFSDKVLSGNGSKILYFEQPDYLDGWRKFAKGTTLVTASASDRHVFFKFKSTSMFRLFDSFTPPLDEQRFDLYFYSGKNSQEIKVALQYASETPSNNGKGTVYKLEYVDLSCNNRNYLKLICSDNSGRFEFSLSKTEVQSETIKYRLAYRTGLIAPIKELHELAIYHYGELKINEKGKLSDLPVGGQILPGMR